MPFTHSNDITKELEEALYMFSLFQKKNTIDNSPERAAIIEEWVKLNDLSPMQLQQLLSQNFDINFIHDAISCTKEHPDVEYLLQKFTPNAELLSRPRSGVAVESVIQGVVTGDVIGSTRKFTPPTKVKELITPESHVTDESQLTFATYAALKEKALHPDFRKHYIKAYHNDPDAGHTQNFALWAQNKMTKNVKGEVVHVDNLQGYHSKTHGAASRIAPIAAHFKCPDIMARHALESILTTHDHVEGIKGALVTVYCVWLALHGASKTEIDEYCKSHYMSTPEQRAKMTDGKYRFDYANPFPVVASKASQFASYAVPYAVYCFCNTESYEECMEMIVSHFGDNDAICAIAGGIATAYYDNMPVPEENA